MEGIEDRKKRTKDKQSETKWVKRKSRGNLCKRRGQEK